MEISVLLFKQILSMFLMILLGFILVKQKILKSQDSRILSVILLYLVMPCVILNAFQVDYSDDTMLGLLFAGGVAVVMHIIMLTVTAILGKVFHLTEVERASVIYSNAGNLIVPIVTAILGSEWVIYSSAYLIVQTILIWTHGKSLLSGEKGADLKKIVTNTNLIAIAVGVVLFASGLRLPSVLAQTVSSVGNMVAPASMFITGMLIAGMDWTDIFGKKRTYAIVFLRMIFFPAIMLVLMRFCVGIAPMENAQTVLIITLLACCTPPASTVTQMAQVYHRDAEYASAVNVISTLLCIVTMPVVVALYLL